MVDQEWIKLKDDIDSIPSVETFDGISHKTAQPIITNTDNDILYGVRKRMICPDDCQPQGNSRVIDGYYKGRFIFHQYSGSSSTYTSEIRVTQKIDYPIRNGYRAIQNIGATTILSIDGVNNMETTYVLKEGLLSDGYHLFYGDNGYKLSTHIVVKENENGQIVYQNKTLPVDAGSCYWYYPSGVSVVDENTAIVVCSDTNRRGRIYKYSSSDDTWTFIGSVNSSVNSGEEVSGRNTRYASKLYPGQLYYITSISDEINFYRYAGGSASTLCAKADTSTIPSNSQVLHVDEQRGVFTCVYGYQVYNVNAFNGTITNSYIEKSMVKNTKILDFLPIQNSMWLYSYVLGYNVQCCIRLSDNDYLSVQKYEAVGGTSIYLAFLDWIHIPNYKLFGPNVSTSYTTFFSYNNMLYVLCNKPNGASPSSWIPRLYSFDGHDFTFLTEGTNAIESPLDLNSVYTNGFTTYTVCDNELYVLFDTNEASSTTSYLYKFDKVANKFMYEAGFEKSSNASMFVMLPSINNELYIHKYLTGEIYRYDKTTKQLVFVLKSAYFNVQRLSKGHFFAYNNKIYCPCFGEYINNIPHIDPFATSFTVFDGNTCYIQNIEFAISMQDYFYNIGDEVYYIYNINNENYAHRLNLSKVIVDRGVLMDNNSNDIPLIRLYSVSENISFMGNIDHVLYHFGKITNCPPIYSEKCTSDSGIFGNSLIINLSKPGNNQTIKYLLKEDL